MQASSRPLLYVIGSAIFFGMSTPFSKALIGSVGPVTLAGLLYLGAFFGLTAYSMLHRLFDAQAMTSAPLERRDAPYLAGAIALGGIVAPILLMMGVSQVTGLTASLLLSLEGAATCSIAVLFFKENVGWKLLVALLLMTLAGVALAWSPERGGFSAWGMLIIIVAMVCWGADNNLTQRVSLRDPVKIVLLKGSIAGTLSLAVGLAIGEVLPEAWVILSGLALGALSYGLSLVLFIKALEGLGASRTGAFFGMAPFIGALLSVVILGDQLVAGVLVAAPLMALGAYLVITERHGHEHRHGRMVHAHGHEHDLHHQHPHEMRQEGAHFHEHTHEEMAHSHVHWPDAHHRHDH